MVSHVQMETSCSDSIDEIEEERSLAVDLKSHTSTIAELWSSSLELMTSCMQWRGASPE